MIKISVPGMSCNHCVARITSALETVQGIGDFRVMLETRQVEVGEGTDIERVIKAIEQAGYTATR